MNKPWENEPDELTGEYCGLQTYIKRNPHSLTLCGYIGVSKDHPLFGKDREEYIQATELDLHREIDVTQVDIFQLMGEALRDDRPAGTMPVGMFFRVHGGITWSENKKPCQEPDGYWWFGFDCGHAGDMMPAYDFTYGTYRDIEFVKAECEKLAQQMYNYARRGEIKHAV